MTTIALILSGSGVYDGSEIHEASLTYYFLDKAGINCLFPPLLLPNPPGSCTE